MAFNSRLYWEKRYSSGGNSGSGSYGALSSFKSEVINSFMLKNSIKSIIDYGVGDGNQLKLIDTTNRKYIGIDVSSNIIGNCKKMFNGDTTKEFYLDTEIPTDIKGDLALSCDVLYHLIEDDIYHKYLNNLFNYSDKFVIIYARNDNVNHAEHVKFRKFTEVIITFKDWRLIQHIPNKYPQTILGKNNHNTSPSDFYIYQKN